MLDRLLGRGRDVSKIGITININMNTEGPYFYALDGETSFKPPLVRVLAHEIGHVAWFAGLSLGIANDPITIENAIMRELDMNASIRHPSKGHLK